MKDQAENKGHNEKTRARIQRRVNRKRLPRALDVRVRTPPRLAFLIRTIANRDNCSLPEALERQHDLWTCTEFAYFQLQILEILYLRQIANEAGRVLGDDWEMRLQDALGMYREFLATSKYKPTALMEEIMNGGGLYVFHPEP